MDFVELREDRRVEHPISFVKWEKAPEKGIWKKEDFEKLPKMQVAYYQGNDEAEKVEFFTQPTFLVSNAMKALLERYDSSIPMKGVQAFPFCGKEAPVLLYWIPWLKEVDCLHTDWDWLAAERKETLLLSKEKLPDLPIFQVKSTSLRKIVVSLALAESLFRRRFYGVGFREIRIREEKNR